MFSGFLPQFCMDSTFIDFLNIRIRSTLRWTNESTPWEGREADVTVITFSCIKTGRFVVQTTHLYLSSRGPHSNWSHTSSETRKTFSIVDSPATTDTGRQARYNLARNKCSFWPFLVRSSVFLTQLSLLSNYQMLVILHNVCNPTSVGKGVCSIAQVLGVDCSGQHFFFAN